MPIYTELLLAAQMKLASVQPVYQKPKPVTVQVEQAGFLTKELIAETQETRSVSYQVPRYNHFSYGWCTYYVASKREIPWHGNANRWLFNAGGMGFETAHKPLIGAVMVTSESGYGHVAFVEDFTDNTVTVSEMNFAGWAVISSRTISRDSHLIEGYIY
jgi:surface antigen